MTRDPCLTTTAILIQNLVSARVCFMYKSNNSLRVLLLAFSKFRTDDTLHRCIRWVTVGHFRCRSFTWVMGQCYGCQNTAIPGVHNFAQNWPSCAELTKRYRNCKILQILFSNIALSLTLTAATASAKHSGVKVIK